MGKAKSKTNDRFCTYIVARYKEAGNMGGVYKKNVKKGRFIRELCEKLNELIGDIPDDSNADNHTDENNDKVSEDASLEELMEKLGSSTNLTDSGNDGGNHDLANMDGSTNSDNVENSSQSVGSKDIDTGDTNPDPNIVSNPFDENGVQTHNLFRKLHGSKDMTIDPALSKEAAAYAKELAIIGSLKHAHLENVGENLAYGCSPVENYKMTAAEATKKW